MIEQNACKYRAKTRARDFTNLLAKSGGSEIASPCFNAIFTSILLDHGSLPPDFANRFVKSLAHVLTRYLQVFCSITAHFRQILPADL